MAAIAEDRNVVGDLEDLIHLVGDVNNRNALLLERTDHAEKMSHLAVGNRRSWFVHDDQAGIVGDCLGNFDHLRIGDAQFFHHGSRIDVDLKPLEQRFGIRDHLALVKQPPLAHRLAPQEDIFRHRHIRHR